MKIAEDFVYCIIRVMTRRNNNPKGKGGFGDHPENRSNGKWSKDTSVSYWYNKLGRMDNAEFKTFKPANPFQEIAYKRVQAAISTADGELALKNTKEITDRVEGRPKQDIDLDISGDAAVIIKGFVIPSAPSDFINKDIKKQAGEEYLK